MKKKYIKPCVCVDSFEVKSCILEMSYRGVGENGEEIGARERYLGSASKDRRGSRGYGSNGSNGSGWGSLW